MNVSNEPIKHKSHLIHVESLPEDSIQITNYGNHEFSNLYYSPENKKLYQQYRKRIREIDTNNLEASASATERQQAKPGPEGTSHGIKKNIYVRTNKGKTLYISNKKLNKIIESLNK